jgi:hypothetical protein
MPDHRNWTMMTRARLLALAGVLLGSLLTPAAASALPNTALVRAQFPGDMTSRSFRGLPVVAGNMTVRVTQATHETGIASAWLKVDDALAAEVRLPCASDLSIECDDVLTPLELTIDTRRFTGGLHQVTVGVTHGDGETSHGSSTTMLMDNSVPGPPVPVSALEVFTRKTTHQISWRGPAGEGGALTAQITVCDAAGCRPAAASGAGGFVATNLPIGLTTVRVVLRDAAGNVDPVQATTWRITRVPVVRPSAGLTITSARLGADHRTVTVAGRVRAVTDGKVTVSLRVHARGGVRTIRRVATVAGGRFSARLVAPSRSWRHATLTATTKGDRMVAPGRESKRLRQS